VRHILANRYLLALLVVTAVAAEFGLASVSHPAALASPRTPAPARAPVSAAVRACPAPGSGGATAAGIALAAASAGGGQARIARLSPIGSAATPGPLRVLTRPGQLALVSVPLAPVLARGATAGPNLARGSAVPTGPARGGVMIQASGSMAQGFEAEQTAAGGLATAQCPSPGTDFWFVAPGQKSVADIQLYLMNTNSQAADATVQILTDSGPVLGNTDAGIGVPAHGLVVQSLAKLLHGSRVVALNVTTSVGQVAASVLETSGGSEPGAWLPAAQAPATSQVLPGLPGTPGERELYIAVPGGDNAQVKVTAVTERGSYQPTGGGISLPGGSAVAVALPSLGGTAAAVAISSNVPVTASMTVAGGAAGAPGAFTAATPPVQEQGVIAGNAGGSGGSSVLVLSAPQGAAQVRVTELPTATGLAAAAPRVVQLAAGHTVVVTLTPRRPAVRPSAFAVVVTPLAGSGPVYAGRVTSVGGVVRSILPVASSLTWIPLPAVRSSLTTALP
jgi:Family of unknown function (DUF5719)